MTARLGAGRGRRSEERSGTRNGSRPRTMSNPARDVEVKMPRLRKGVVLPGPTVAAPQDRSAAAGETITAYVKGTSSRKVDDLVKALGGDWGVSK